METFNVQIASYLDRNEGCKLFLPLIIFLDRNSASLATHGASQKSRELEDAAIDLFSKYCHYSVEHAQFKIRLNSILLDVCPMVEDIANDSPSSYVIS
jgi:hypothetical protein